MHRSDSEKKMEKSNKNKITIFCFSFGFRSNRFWSMKSELHWAVVQMVTERHSKISKRLASAIWQWQISGETERKNRNFFSSEKSKILFHFIFWSTQSDEIHSYCKESSLETGFTLRTWIPLAFDDVKMTWTEFWWRRGLVSMQTHNEFSSVNKLKTHKMRSIEIRGTCTCPGKIKPETHTKWHEFLINMFCFCFLLLSIDRTSTVCNFKWHSKYHASKSRHNIVRRVFWFLLKLPVLVTIGENMVSVLSFIIFVLDNSLSSILFCRGSQSQGILQGCSSAKRWRFYLSSGRWVENGFQRERNSNGRW